MSSDDRSESQTYAPVDEAPHMQCGRRIVFLCNMMSNRINTNMYTDLPMIQWNKVTWYSKLVAVILFVAVFFLGFHLGKMA
jgi:hypothetical protein